MAKELEATDAVGNAEKTRAVCRGAIVLLCSHIEGYIKELGELTLAQLYEREICRSKIPHLVAYHVSKDLVSSIKDTSDTTRLATQLFDLINRDLPYWQSEGPIGSPFSEERFNKGFASPSFNKIASYFGRFGHVDYKRDLGFILAGDYATCKTLINHIVDIRNKIAHGNPSLSKTPSDLLDAASTVQVFCRSTDDVFAKWCKQNLCPIR